MAWHRVYQKKTIHSISLLFGTFSAVKIEEVWGQHDADFESYVTIRMGGTSHFLS